MSNDEDIPPSLTSFKGTSSFLELPYWEPDTIPTIGHFHILLFGLVKDFLTLVSLHILKHIRSIIKGKRVIN